MTLPMFTTPFDPRRAKKPGERGFLVLAEEGQEVQGVTGVLSDLSSRAERAGAHAVVGVQLVTVNDYFFAIGPRWSGATSRSSRSTRPRAQASSVETTTPTGDSTPGGYEPGVLPGRATDCRRRPPRPA
jgi:hypothetical protein